MVMPSLDRYQEGLIQWVRGEAKGSIALPKPEQVEEQPSRPRRRGLLHPRLGTRMPEGWSWWRDSVDCEAAIKVGPNIFYGYQEEVLAIDQFRKIAKRKKGEKILNVHSRGCNLWKIEVGGPTTHYLYLKTNIDPKSSLELYTSEYFRFAVRAMSILSQFDSVILTVLWREHDGVGAHGSFSRVVSQMHSSGYIVHANGTKPSSRVVYDKREIYSNPDVDGIKIHTSSKSDGQNTRATTSYKRGDRWSDFMKLWRRFLKLEEASESSNGTVNHGNEEESSSKDGGEHQVRDDANDGHAGELQRRPCERFRASSEGGGQHALRIDDQRR